MHRFHFYFYGFGGFFVSRSCNGWANTTTGGNVVFFDQKCIIQTDAMVVTLATSYGIFLGFA